MQPFGALLWGTYNGESVEKVVGKDLRLGSALEPVMVGIVAAGDLFDDSSVRRRQRRYYTAPNTSTGTFASPSSGSHVMRLSNPPTPTTSPRR